MVAGFEELNEQEGSSKDAVQVIFLPWIDAFMPCI